MKIDFQLRITAQQRQVRCYCHGSREQEKTTGPDHTAVRPSPRQDQVSSFYTSHLRHGSRELWVPSRAMESVSLSLSLCVSCCTNKDIVQLAVPRPQQSRVQPLNCQWRNKSSHPHRECKVSPEFQSSFERKEFASHQIQERPWLPRVFHKQPMKN